MLTYVLQGVIAGVAAEQTQKVKENENENEKKQEKDGEDDREQRALALLAGGSGRITVVRSPDPTQSFHRGIHAWLAYMTHQTSVVLRVHSPTNMRHGTPTGSIFSKEKNANDVPKRVY